VIDTAKLKEKILDLAIRGKLVSQDPNDEPASVLLEKIRAEKLQMVKEGKLKQKDIKDDTVIFVGEDNLHYEKFGDGSIKCIEDEIPFDIPKSWAWCRISNLALVLNGDRGQHYPAKNKLTRKGIPFVSAANIKEGLISNENLFCLSEEQYSLLSAGKLIYNDIVYCIRGSLGKCGIYKQNKGAIASSLVIVRSLLDQNYIIRYLYYYLCTELSKDEISKYDGGSAQPNLAAKDFLRFFLPLPPLSEIEKITSKIDKSFNLIDTIIKANNDEKDLITLIKSKILDLAIRGKLVPQDPNDEPADVLLERIRKEKEKLIKQGKIKRDKKESIIFKGDDNSYYEQFEKNKEKVDEEIPFNIPDSWQWVRLGSYAQKITDYVASGSFSSLRENVPVLKNKDYALMVKTADFSNNFTQNLTYTTEQGYNYLENSNLFGGELILSNIGSIGKVFIVPELDQKMTLAPNTVMVKLLHDEYRDYVYNFLLSPLGYSQLLKISGGTGIAKFNKTDLKTLLLPIPPIKEQERIIKQIKVLFDLLSEMENSIK